MIEVFISHRGPFDGRHGTEKAVGMGCALFRPAGRKPVNPADQTLLLLSKQPLIAYDQALHGRHIPADRPFAQEGLLCQSSEDPPNQTSWRRLQSSRNLQPCRTMGHHLRNVHHAPLLPAVRPEASYPIPNFRGRRRFKQVFHRCFSSSNVSSAACNQTISFTFMKLRYRACDFAQ